MRYSPKALLDKEPAVITSTLVAIVNALVLFNVLSWTAEQIAGANVALLAVLGLFVRAKVTPNSSVAATTADLEALHSDSGQ